MKKTIWIPIVGGFIFGVLSFLISAANITIEISKDLILGPYEILDTLSAALFGPIGLLITQLGMDSGAYWYFIKDVPQGITSTLHWQRVTSLAPLLGAGYAAYQFGNIPGFEHLRVTLGGVAIDTLPDPLLSFGLLPLVQGLALGIGFAVTVTTLWKIWPADMTRRGIRWIRGQAFSLGAATVYAAVLLLVMVMRPEWMLI